MNFLLLKPVSTCWLTSLFLMILAVFTQAEKEQILLWKSKVPGFSDNFQHQPAEEVREGVISKTSQPFFTVTPAKEGTATGQGLVILPGGGYGILAHSHEGEQVAEKYAAQGITCFVVRYRVGGRGVDPAYRFPYPLIDARQGIRMAKALASKYKVDPEKIGVLGFSAGGHLAAMCSTMYDESFPEEPDSLESARPAFGALIYPVASMSDPKSHSGSRKNLLGITEINQLTEEEKVLLESTSPELRVKEGCPPVFIAHNQFDKVDATLSLNLAAAYTRELVPCELHFFPAAPHGFGMGRETETEMSNPGTQWPGLFAKFLQRQLR